MDTSVKIGSIILKNPVTVASGTFGYGEEYSELIDINKLGGIFTKAITVKPREGNPPPRIVETSCGMLNSIGLANVGVDVFIKEKIPFLKKYDTAVFVNIAGSTVEEYLEVVNKLENTDKIDGLEINISCPNVKHGGLSFGFDPKTTFDLMSEIRKNTKRILIAKLSPNVTAITEIAKAAVDAGSDALSLINTVVGMAIDIKTKKPKLANITGGLSGPAIKPIGIANVWKVAQKVSVPIIGIGGIMSADDAIEYIIAGASAVQIGTGVFVDPQIPENIIKGIEDYCKANNISSIKDLTNSLQAN